MSERLLAPLAKSPFACAGPLVLERLAPLFVARRVAKGALVFVEGDTDGRFFVIGEGRLKAFRNLPGGRSITVFNLAGGDFFGFIPLLDGGPFPVSVSAVTPALLFVLSRDEFQRALAEVPELCPALLAYTAKRLRDCLDHVGQLGRKGAVPRAANALLSIVAAGSKCSGSADIVLPSTQAELARSADITPENLSRALTRLCRDGVIERTGTRAFRIPDIAELSRVAETHEPLQRG
jgi:CRP/FNR family transcriptional regulator